jgi:ubiquinone/menaquinone biosynthesis C-methylase UbiE
MTTTHNDVRSPGPGPGGGCQGSGGRAAEPLTEKGSLERSNQSAYEVKRVVEDYATASELQPPEATILRILDPELRNMRVLDIGVGGGRTTVHLAPRVKDYVGIDSSHTMIAVCKGRFAGLPPDKVSFQFGDVRSMAMFPDHRFDFILFSFNGLDCVNEIDRMKAMKEIHRIGKPGGYFCFSAHNMGCLHQVFEFKWQLTWNPKRLARNLIKWFIVRFYLNRHTSLEKMKASPYVVVNDGAHRFRMLHYYIWPSEQLEQLAPLFDDIRVFGLNTGEEVTGREDLDRLDDGWFYYLCKFK